MKLKTHVPVQSAGFAIKKNATHPGYLNLIMLLRESCSKDFMIKRAPLSFKNKTSPFYLSFYSTSLLSCMICTPYIWPKLMQYWFD